MKRIFLLMTMVCLLATLANAQKFTKAFSNASGAKRVVIEVDNSEIRVVAHDAREVSIEGEGGDYKISERAKGLRPLYNDAQDNTGLGLEVTESSNTITIKKASGKEGEYLIKVPADAAVSIEEKNWDGSEIRIKGIKGEIEVKSLGSDILLEDITGPVVANTTSGDITVVFSQVSQAGPTNISNISGFIDVSMPASTKANLRLESISGDIYTDFDLSSKDKMQRIGGSNVKAQLNGGGVEVTLKAISGEVYLRKK
ncbi:MAG: DUF4097 family beta strand repeat protein [Saprospiraceae bacterium]|nr:DUF4097 family beta strand repeat protein [Saprospiraceae bacterium]